jgi:hypothetical protein
MLALRFCIPPSVGFDLTLDFMADIDLDVDLDVAFHADADFTAYATALANLPVPDPPTPDEAFDQIFGTDSAFLPMPIKGVWLKEMALNADFNDDYALAEAAVRSTDPDDAVPPEPPALEPVPDDPLCH